MKALNDNKRNKRQSINVERTVNNKETISDLSQTKEFIKVLSDEISSIIEQLLNKLYDVKVADQFAESLIYLYDKLSEKGLSQQTIERILCEYSANVEKLATMFRKEKK